MKRKLASLILLGVVVPAMAQQAPSRLPGTNDVAPVISKLTITPDTVTDLRLKPFYAATIRMPEAVSSVVVGAPTLFLAEHNEHEPDLVVVKPITAEPAVSNLLIATKSGLVVSLRLLSDGSASGSAKPVDFVLIYKRHGSFLIGSVEENLTTPAAATKPGMSAYESAFRQQTQVSNPEWDQSKGAIAASLGAVTGNGDDIIVAFSVLNNTSHWVELLPPQVELANSNSKGSKNNTEEGKTKKVLADQVAIREFRFAEQKLAPGARADGVVRFERPDFKQNHLMLVLCVIMYAKGFVGAVGTYAIGTQILFFSVATAASYGLSFGLAQRQRSVLALGMSTRNIGAAFAPLFAIPGIDQRAVVMVALGVPMQTIFSLLAASWFSRRAPEGEPAAQTPDRIEGPREG